ncbi:hypothetical protein JMUB6875_67660 [Nocardia sp. JMUB6875]|uniref:SgcJ/EcaC family oxidoreductase n=1 Tax=Nocardia sp. JMUB6875 TaxID=3158170 RepID=UPI0032E5E829
MTTTRQPAAWSIPSELAREQVLRLLWRQHEAWAAGGGAAFAATFTGDAYFVSVVGEFISGRAELARVMQAGFDGFMKGTRMLEPDLLEIRFPTADLAVLVTKGAKPRRPDGPDTEESSIQTRVAVRAAGEWLFTSFHNTFVRTP